MKKSDDLLKISQDDFGERLRQARLRCGQKLREMAGEIGSRVDTLSRTELGKNAGLTFGLLAGIVRWAVMHEIPLEWLFAGREADSGDESEGAAPVYRDPDWLAIASLNDLLGVVSELAVDMRLVQQQIRLANDPAARADLLKALYPDWQPAGQPDEGSTRPLPAGESPLYQIAEFIEPGFSIYDADQLPERWVGEFVPIINRIAAGKGIDTAEAEQYPAGLAARYLKYTGAPDNAFALEVQGDSMIPQLYHGDMVIVDPSRQARPGTICAVITQTNGDRVARVKKLIVRGKTAELQSIDQDYPLVRAPATSVAAFAIWKYLPTVYRHRTQNGKS